jgi:hypothetical protein
VFEVGKHTLQFEPDDVEAALAAEDQSVSGSFIKVARSISTTNWHANGSRPLVPKAGRPALYRICICASFDATGPEHEFWALDYLLSEMRAELKERVISPRHLLDALLLDLAIRKQGRLVTFDNLVPPAFPLLGALWILPADDMADRK